MSLALGYVLSLGAMLLRNHFNNQEYTQVIQADVQERFRTVQASMVRYKMDTGTNPRGLVDLVTRPAGVKGWRGPYYPYGLPLDPWGRPFGYSSPTGGEYTITCLGEDGAPGGTDADGDLAVTGR